MGILGSNLVVVSLVQFHKRNLRMSEFNQLDLVVFHFSLLFYSLVFMDLAQGHRVMSYLSCMCHTCHSYGHEISDMAEIEICNTMFHVSDAILDNLLSNISITLDVRLSIVKMYANDQTSLLV